MGENGNHNDDADYIATLMTTVQQTDFGAGG